VLARPAAFCDAGMPSTGSTESDGTFVGPALGLAGLPGYELTPVRAAPRRGALVGVREERRRGTRRSLLFFSGVGNARQALVLVAVNGQATCCQCTEGHDAFLSSVCLCRSGGSTGRQAWATPHSRADVGASWDGCSNASRRDVLASG
jgi:hypothetical protein